MYNSLFTIVSLPVGTVSMDEGTKQTTISFSENQKIVLDEHFKIEQVDDMDDLTDDLQGRRVDGFSSDGDSFSKIDLQPDTLSRLESALSSGDCVIRVRKISLAGSREVRLIA